MYHSGVESCVLGYYWGLKGVWELSVLSIQFCCEPKAAFKNKVFLKRESEDATYDLNLERKSVEV